MKIKKTVLGGVFIALIFATTYFTKFPIPGGGYFNLGDCFVILAGVVFGPVWGGVCAGIGSAFSDAFAGYMAYVPITFAVKFLMALAVGFISNKDSIIKSVISVLVSEVIMVLGYFIAETCLFGAAAATAGVLGNLAQGGASIVLGIVLIALTVKNNAIKKAINSI